MGFLGFTSWKLFSQVEEKRPRQDGVCGARDVFRTWFLTEKVVSAVVIASNLGMIFIFCLTIKGVKRECEQQ